VAARQGFYWWELDATYYVLRGLAALGLIWGLHGVPDHVRDAAHGDAAGLLPGSNETPDVA
jgi:stearoyl-CoA desaturase (delta-9 desaturase)